MTKREQQLELQLVQERKWRDGLDQTQALIQIGLEALSLRMLTTLVLVADCVLFAWAIYASGWQQLTAAVLFAVASWAVLYYRPPERRKGTSNET